MPTDPDDEARLRRLEEALWRPETRFDRTWMERTIAGDCFEFGRSGRIYSRDEILAAGPERFEVRLPLPNFGVRWLASDVAQVTYDSIVRYAGPWLHSRRSSIWSRAGGDWSLRFHPGTPYEPDR